MMVRSPECLRAFDWRLLGFPAIAQEGVDASLSGCVKTTALGYAALEAGSKYSFTPRKLRFLPCLRSLRFIPTVMCGLRHAARQPDNHHGTKYR